MGASTPEHFTNYGYDNSGRLSTVTSPAGTFTYTYTPNSSLIGTVTGPAHTVTNTWEPNRDVLDIKENKIPSTSNPISRFDYQVNVINQRTQVETTGSAFLSQPADWNWGYDALGQVVSADSPTNTFDRSYEYDQIGNRKKSADGTLVTTGSSATAYDANNLNQYSQISVPSVSSVVPIHDQDGNATSYPLPVDPSDNATLAYDGENRLVSVTTSTTSVSYTYDSQSRRIARTEGNNTTVYLYDAWNCIFEYSLDNSSFNLHTSHTWGLDFSGSLQGAGSVGGLLSVTKHEAQSTTHFFPTYDGNGNISEYLTASGSIAGHNEYDPFGNVVVATGPQASGFQYRFSTKSADPATGLLHYGLRWLDPGTGRWINRDPIQEQGGANLHAFVRNNGINLIDMLGLWDVDGVLKILCCEKYKDKVAELAKLGIFSFKSGESLWNIDGIETWVTITANGLHLKPEEGPTTILVRESLSNDTAAAVLLHELTHTKQDLKSLSVIEAEVEAYTVETQFMIDKGIPMPKERENWVKDGKPDQIAIREFVKNHPTYNPPAGHVRMPSNKFKALTKTDGWDCSKVLP